jgi:hypothetical protein
MDFASATAKKSGGHRGNKQDRGKQPGKYVEDKIKLKEREKEKRENKGKIKTSACLGCAAEMACKVAVRFVLVREGHRAHERQRRSALVPKLLARQRVELPRRRPLQGGKVLVAYRAHCCKFGSRQGGLQARVGLVQLHPLLRSRGEIRVANKQGTEHH